MSTAVRFCPKCETERSPAEFFCQGEVHGTPCEWNLSGEPLREAGWRPVAKIVEQEERAPGPTCPNGHPVSPGDLMCGECFADLEANAEHETPDAGREIGGGAAGEVSSALGAGSIIGGWRLDRALPSSSPIRDRFLAIREADEHAAVLTLYAVGSEPDPEVQDAVRALSLDHVPELLETGRFEDRVFEVSEELRGGTLDVLGLTAHDLESQPSLVKSARALMPSARLGFATETFALAQS